MGTNHEGRVQRSLKFLSWPTGHMAIPVTNMKTGDKGEFQAEETEFCLEILITHWKWKSEAQKEERQSQRGKDHHAPSGQLFWGFLLLIFGLSTEPFMFAGRKKGWGMASKTTLNCVQFSSVQLLSRVQLFVTPWTTTRQASLSITKSQSLPKPMSIESVMPSNHFILCHPLLLLPSIFPSIRVFSNESALCIRWPKYWSFSFNISPSNDHPGLISFRMDRLDLLAVQGTLKSLLQHHSSKASILWH